MRSPPTLVDAARLRRLRHPASPARRCRHTAAGHRSSLQPPIAAGRACTPPPAAVSSRRPPRPSPRPDSCGWRGHRRRPPPPTAPLPAADRRRCSRLLPPTADCRRRPRLTPPAYFHLSLPLLLAAAGRCLTSLPLAAVAGRRCLPPPAADAGRCYVLDLSARCRHRPLTTAAGRACRPPPSAAPSPCCRQKARGTPSRSPPQLPLYVGDYGGRDHR